MHKIFTITNLGYGWRGRGRGEEEGGQEEEGVEPKFGRNFSSFDINIYCMYLYLYYIFIYLLYLLIVFTILTFHLRSILSVFENNSSGLVLNGIICYLQLELHNQKHVHILNNAHMVYGDIPFCYRIKDHQNSVRGGPLNWQKVVEVYVRKAK